jgi:hypothetical protein
MYSRFCYLCLGRQLYYYGMEIGTNLFVQMNYAGNPDTLKEFKCDFRKLDFDILLKSIRQKFLLRFSCP